MRLIYPSAKELTKSLEAVWNLVDEATFDVKEDGISLMAIDPSQISMVVYKLEKEHFMEFELEEETKIHVDMDYLKKIMKRGKDKEMVRLETEQNRLVIGFETEKAKRIFKIPLLDPIGGINKEPSIEYKNWVKISAEALRDIVNDASLISNYIKFVLTPDGLEATTSSETGEVEEIFEKEGEEILELNVEEGAKAYYPIQYLDDILKAAPKSDFVTLYLETDMPLKTEYLVGRAFVRYYLAPRREE